MTGEARRARAAMTAAGPAPTASAMHGRPAWTAPTRLARPEGPLTSRESSAGRPIVPTVEPTVGLITAPTPGHRQRGRLAAPADAQAAADSDVQAPPRRIPHATKAWGLPAACGGHPTSDQSYTM